MRDRSRFVRTSIAALAASVLPSIAAADDVTRSYAAIYRFDSANGSTGVSETLTIRRSGTTGFVSVSNARGAVLTIPTVFRDDGEIVENASDPSVVCYNLALAALDRQRRPDGSATVGVRVAGRDVDIPFVLSETKPGNDGASAFLGAGERVVAMSDGANVFTAELRVEGRIDVRRGALGDATFVETTLLGSPARAASRMTCSLTTAASAPHLVESTQPPT